MSDQKYHPDDIGLALIWNDVALMAAEESARLTSRLAEADAYFLETTGKHLFEVVQETQDAVAAQLGAAIAEAFAPLDQGPSEDLRP